MSEPIILSCEDQVTQLIEENAALLLELESERFKHELDHKLADRWQEQRDAAEVTIRNQAEIIASLRAALKDVGNSAINAALSSTLSTLHCGRCTHPLNSHGTVGGNCAECSCARFRAPHKNTPSERHSAKSESRAPETPNHAELT